MIVNFILQSAINFFTWIIGLMPNFQGLPTGITQGFDFFSDYWNDASVIFPVGTAFQILALMVGIEIGIFVWRMWWFSYKKIPGKFT